MSETDLNRVEKLWLEYRESVVPRDAHCVQLQECRRAFYAGVHSFFTELMAMLDADRDPTESDTKKLGLIEVELRRFNDRVKAGLA